MLHLYQDFALHGRSFRVVFTRNIRFRVDRGVFVL
jgi:hypothetical protein